MKFLLRISLLIILFSSIVHADTAPTYAYESWGGGIDFTCDDEPCNPICAEEQEEQVVSLGIIPESSNPDFLPLEGGKPETTNYCAEEEDSCFVSTKSKNYDKCIWSGEGPNCEDKQKCCEYPKDKNGKPDKSRCECLTKITPEVTPAHCLDCLCLGEMANQPDDCKKLMLCVAHNDAKKLDPNNPEAKYCEAATGQVPTNRNAWRFSAARCICDRSTGDTDERGVNGNGVRGYSQIMCDCLEGKELDKPTQRALEACKQARTNLNCGANPWTHYAVGTEKKHCPCSPSRVKGTQTCGDHIFCDCS